MAGYYYETLETITSPAYILEGDEGELWAIKYISKKKVFLVIYTESEKHNDGFIITAFMTTKIKKLLKRRMVWQQEQQH